MRPGSRCGSRRCARVAGSNRPRRDFGRARLQPQSTPPILPPTVAVRGGRALRHRVRFLTSLILAALLTAVCFATPAHADKRVALVIGNSAYKNVTPLDNPRNDARLIADTLRGLGFMVVGGGA